MNSWNEATIRSVCQKCSGLCCTDPFLQVCMDYEMEKKRLSKYKYDKPTMLWDYPTLKKDKNGACVYFNHETRGCGIYDRRPAACRVWFCGRGTRNDCTWKILQERKRKRKERKHGSEK